VCEGVVELGVVFIWFVHMFCLYVRFVFGGDLGWVCCCWWVLIFPCWLVGFR